ncbi:hypothetical protein HPB51_019843 [Rhipicephalus microplus]|uniref:Cas1p 10 TM acyl transferase domain-containing protein n=1 Tax=Rhipicephalus microplus TaxID=6941 RepID=A0A9J6DBS8_RHIMP|nr:hypothetical protein HPB51_019843 [Rhipicephalus microplus]
MPEYTFVNANCIDIMSTFPDDNDDWWVQLFIAQYHIWLAADTHGVLVLVPGYPVLNVMVTSLVLVCVAHEVHVLTGCLMPLAVPADWKYLVRNVVVFGLLLVPIGIHDGMF